jgi:hypothetical protein
MEQGKAPASEAGTVVRLTRTAGAVVLSLTGAADSRLVSLLCDALDEIGPEPVMVDLSDVLLTDPEVVRDLVTLLELDASAGRCIVSRRATSRAVIRRIGGTRLPLFGSVSDAAQVKLLADAGCGDGWLAGRGPRTGVARR